MKEQQMTTGPKGVGEGPFLLAESKASAHVQLGNDGVWMAPMGPRGQGTAT